MDNPCQLSRVLPPFIWTFDSSYPTKAARHGVVFTSQGPLRMEQRTNATDFGPLDPNCPCPTRTRFSKAYLHHLFKAKEQTGGMLASLHNLAFMVKKTEKMREDILADVL